MWGGGGDAWGCHLDFPPVGGIKLFGVEDVDEEGGDRASVGRQADILECRRLKDSYGETNRGEVDSRKVVSWRSTRTRSLKHKGGRGT